MEQTLACLTVLADIIRHNRGSETLELSHFEELEEILKDFEKAGNKIGIYRGQLFINFNPQMIYDPRINSFMLDNISRSRGGVEFGRIRKENR